MLYNDYAIQEVPFWEHEGFKTFIHGQVAAEPKARPVIATPVGKIIRFIFAGRPQSADMQDYETVVWVQEITAKPKKDEQPVIIPGNVEGELRVGSEIRAQVKWVGRGKCRTLEAGKTENLSSAIPYTLSSGPLFTRGMGVALLLAFTVAIALVVWFFASGVVLDALMALVAMVGGALLGLLYAVGPALIVIVGIAIMLRGLFK